MKRIIGVVASIALLALSTSVYAQASLANTPPLPEQTDSSVVKPLSLLEFQLSTMVLSFGLVIILFEVFLIKSRRISPDDSIKFITITLIITSTLFLITAGYSNNQIAPAVGLLGTIAGYLLGKIQTDKPENHETTA